jgi:hypothetical protein
MLFDFQPNSKHATLAKNSVETKKDFVIFAFFSLLLHHQQVELKLFCRLL